MPIDSAEDVLHGNERQTTLACLIAFLGRLKINKATSLKVFMASLMQRFFDGACLNDRVDPLPNFSSISFSWRRGLKDGRLTRGGSNLSWPLAFSHIRSNAKIDLSTLDRLTILIC